MNALNILIVGVGGQGTLFASRIIGNAAIRQSFDVKVSEVHGMSQRGGSVVTYVKIGQKVYSPLIEKKEADFILAFEQLEALRWIEYLKPGGMVIISSQKINPMPVITGMAQYPEDIYEKISKYGCNFIPVDALSIAKQCGSVKAANMVLVGVMAGLSSIKKEVWIETIKETIPDHLVDINMKAFEAGYNYKQN